MSFEFWSLFWRLSQKQSPNPGHERPLSLLRWTMEPSRATQVSFGGEHTLALRSDGQVLRSAGVCGPALTPSIQSIPHQTQSRLARRRRILPQPRGEGMWLSPGMGMRRLLHHGEEQWEHPDIRPGSKQDDGRGYRTDAYPERARGGGRGRWVITASCWRSRPDAC